MEICTLMALLEAAQQLIGLGTVESSNNSINILRNLSDYKMN